MPPSDGDATRGHVISAGDTENGPKVYNESELRQKMAECALSAPTPPTLYEEMQQFYARNTTLVRCVACFAFGMIVASIC